MVYRLAAFALALAALIGAPAPSSAQQVFETVGNRALGMAGAFVAVADDATAVYWNPAGLATAGRVGATIGWAQLRSGNSKAAPVAGQRGQTSTLASLGTWPIGLSYGKQRDTVLVPGSGGAIGLETFETSQFGATILQSIVQGVVLGSTLKYVRGGLSSGLSGAPTTGAALDDGIGLSVSKSGAFDFDLGLMIDMERVRIGVTSRNVRQPIFRDSAGNATVLQRLSRAGLAILPTDGLTLAMDVDLDTVDLRGGLRRMIALGAEHRVSNRLAVRGGLRWNLKIDQGIRQPVVAAGASVKVRAGLWLEGFYTQGRFDGDRGFGFGLRAGS